DPALAAHGHRCSQCSGAHRAVAGHHPAARGDLGGRPVPATRRAALTRLPRPRSEACWHDPSMRPVLLAAAVLALAACGGEGAAELPDREPAVRGTVTPHDGTSGPVLEDASVPCFEGVSLLGGSPTVVDQQARDVTELGE